MARIRTIKPELPHSETLGSVPREARLLFINLFTIVDDDGRARASSRLLASLLYPFDDDAPSLMEGWLSSLEDVGAIRRYEVNGTEYLDIPKWLEHQKIDRPSKSRLPPYSPNTRESSRALDALPRTLDLVSTPIVPKGTGYDAEFENGFWTFYPHKVGKDAAYAAWKKLRKEGRLPHIDVLAGAIEKYREAKPADRAYCNPSTWLNQGRWQDVHASTSFLGRPEPTVSDDTWRERMKRLMEEGRWPPVNGPRPGTGGCLVPMRLVAEFPGIEHA